MITVLIKANDLYIIIIIIINKYDSWLRGISLLNLSDVLTPWMTLKIIFIFKFI